jgi:biopolymer transport protein ExbD
MDLKPKTKIDTSFSMSSMTDIVFLLLIFFMLTAQFVTPSSLPISLPSSVATNVVLQKVSITITKDLRYSINDRQVSFEHLESELKQELNEKEGVVVLHVDKSVPVEHLVKVAGIATKLKAKVSVATKPE